VLLLKTAVEAEVKAAVEAEIEVEVEVEAPSIHSYTDLLAAALYFVVV
jgi:hypothetical protein